MQRIVWPWHPNRQKPPFLGLLNLGMPLTSLRMAAPVALQIPVMAAMGGFQFPQDAGNFRFRFFYLFFDKRNLPNQCFGLECEAALGKGIILAIINQCFSAH